MRSSLAWLCVPGVCVPPIAPSRPCSLYSALDGEECVSNPFGVGRDALVVWGEDKVRFAQVYSFPHWEGMRAMASSCRTIDNRHSNALARADLDGEVIEFRFSPSKGAGLFGEVILRDGSVNYCQKGSNST